MHRPAESVPEFEELARRYALLIRSVVGRVAGSDSERVAEDVEQLVYAALWKRISAAGEQTIRHPPSYIYRMAVRETVRVLKQERRRMERVNELEEETLAGREQDPEELAGNRELSAVIAESLGALSGDRRRAVRAHLAGFDVREIMEMFDWSYNRARNLISRGMADLRGELRARGIDG